MNNKEAPAPTGCTADISALLMHHMPALAQCAASQHASLVDSRKH